MYQKDFFRVTDLINPRGHSQVLRSFGGFHSVQISGGHVSLGDY